MGGGSEGDSTSLGRTCLQTRGAVEGEAETTRKAPSGAGCPWRARPTPCGCCLYPVPGVTTLHRTQSVPGPLALSHALGPRVLRSGALGMPEPSVSVGSMVPKLCSSISEATTSGGGQVHGSPGPPSVLCVPSSLVTSDEWELVVESAELAQSHAAMGTGVRGRGRDDGRNMEFSQCGQWVFMEEKIVGSLPNYLNILTWIIFVIIIWELGVNIAEGRKKV